MIKVDQDNPNYLQIEIGFEEMGGLQNIIVGLDHDRGRLLLRELAEYYAAIAQMTEEDFIGERPSRPDPEIPVPRKSLLRRMWERIFG